MSRNTEKQTLKPNVVHASWIDLGHPKSGGARWSRARGPVQSTRDTWTIIYAAVASSTGSRFPVPHKAHHVGYITCRYNVRVIYVAWRRAALNGSSDVRLRYRYVPASSHLRRNPRFITQRSEGQRVYSRLPVSIPLSLSSFRFLAFSLSRFQQFRDTARSSRCYVPSFGRTPRTGCPLLEQENKIVGRGCRFPRSYFIERDICSQVFRVYYLSSLIEEGSFVFYLNIARR